MNKIVLLTSFFLCPEFHIILVPEEQRQTYKVNRRGWQGKNQAVFSRQKYKPNKHKK